MSNAKKTSSNSSGANSSGAHASGASQSGAVKSGPDATSSTAAAATVNEITRSAEEAVNMTKEKLDETMKASQDAVVKGMDESMAAARDQLSKSGQQWNKGWEEASSQSQEALNSIVASNTALMKGSEEIARIWFSASQSIVDQSMTTMKSVMTASSISEVVDIQSSYAKNTFDTMVAEATRISELSLKAANEAMAPLNTRVNAAMEKMTKPVAA